MDLSKAIGSESSPIPVSWLKRDLLLYSAGIGAKADELDFTYELSKTWHPFPTYPLVLGLKGDHGGELSNFAEMKDAGGATPGMPHLDPNKIVHAEQSIEILKSIPAVSGPGWKIIKKCVGVKDTGKGLIVDGSQELVSPSGETYVRMISSAYAFGNYNANGFAKSIAPKQLVKGGKPPARNADFVLSEKTTKEQAIIYRLSGDYNPLHIDPSIGKALGFGGVILHGLCSYGHAARAIVLKAAGGDGERLQYMSARFTSPVKPGDELETSMWTSELPDGKTRVDFVQQVKGGKVCLGGGVAVLKKKAGASKL